MTAVTACANLALKNRRANCSAKVRGLELVEMAEVGNVLRFRRHVRREVPDDFHRDGRREMRQRHRDRRGLHRLERFELPDALARLAHAAGQQAQNHPPRRSFEPK